MALIFCTSSVAPITPTHISGLKPSDYELKPRNVRPLQSYYANLYFENVLIGYYINEVHKHPKLAPMASMMLEKFENYWESYSFILLILDPRYKIQRVRQLYNLFYVGEAVDVKVKKVKDALTNMYSFYYAQPPTFSSRETPYNEFDNGDDDECRFLALSAAYKVRCKGKSELETSKGLCFTRRDAMICLTTLSASGIGLSSSPEIAEARITKKEMRRKIKEKLEMLREKAGLSKQKDNKETPPSTEDILPLVPSPFPLPNPPMGLEKSLVETTLL